MEDDPDDSRIGFDEVQAVARAKTPSAELVALKVAGGGLRLGYKLMTTCLWLHAKMLFVVTRSSWSYYTAQVKTVKSPGQGMKDALASAQGRWMSHEHLRGMVRDSFCSKSSLDFMEIPNGVSNFANKVLELAWMLLGHRCWSLAVRNDTPPECYIGLLSNQ